MGNVRVVPLGPITIPSIRFVLFVRVTPILIQIVINAYSKTEMELPFAQWEQLLILFIRDAHVLAKLHMITELSVLLALFLISGIIQIECVVNVQMDRFTTQPCKYARLAQLILQLKKMVFVIRVLQDLTISPYKRYAWLALLGLLLIVFNNHASHPQFQAQTAHLEPLIILKLECVYVLQLLHLIMVSNVLLAL
jgi:hypothetical protein